MRTIKFNLQCLAFVGLALLATSCSKEIVKDGISTEKPEIKKMSDTTAVHTYAGLQAEDQSRDPLRNPERGYRSEFFVYASNRQAVFNGQNHTSGLGNAVTAYPLGQTPTGAPSDSLTLSQFYIYLTQEAQTDLSTTSLSNIQYYFDELKNAHIKTLLRFAYDGSPLTTTKIPYTVQHIQRHLQQLTPVFAANMGQIPVIQAGFVGDWGEWGASYYNHTNYADATSVIFKSILNAANNQRQVMARYPRLKNNALTGSVSWLPFTSSDYSRVAFNNDFFTTGLQAPGSDFPIGSADYTQIKNENAAGLWMDGEIPYYSNGTGPYDFNKAMNPMTVLRILSEHRYTSFSMRDQLNGSSKNNLQIWRNTQVSLADIVNSGYSSIPRDTAYFTNMSGQLVTRSYYDFIRDHLGYRFQVQRATFEKNVTRGSNFAIQISLRNIGFSNLINSRNLYLALIDSNNQVTTFSLQEDARSWNVSTQTAAYLLSKQIALPNNLPAGQYKLGLWLPDSDAGLKYDADYAIRFANRNIQHWRDPQSQYLINILGTINLQ